MLAFLRNWVPAALFLASYGLLLAGWRFALDRLVNPIVPLTYALLLTGVSTAFGRYVPRARRWAVLAVATLLAIGAIRRDAPDLKTRLACDRTAPASSPSCWPVPERELLTLTNWIRDSTPADALFFVSKERAFFVHTGRKTINQDRALREDTTSLGAYLRSRGVTHTVLTPTGVRARSHALRLKGACREFDLVKQISPRTMLLQVAPESSPTDSTPACTAIRQFDATDRPAR